MTFGVRQVRRERTETQGIGPRRGMMFPIARRMANHPPRSEGKAGLTLELPIEFQTHMQQWLGDEWPQLRDALDGPAHRAVRLHRLHVGANKHNVANSLFAVASSVPAPTTVAESLREPVPWFPNAYYIAEDSQLGKSIYHECGAFYMQEPSAMAAVAALSPKPGESILDLCAAPGGKTTGIGKLMRGEGLLVANEIHPSRVLVLAQNLERLGVPAVVTNETPQNLADAFPGQFDAVLVDAPCSGEGMFRKDPGAVAEWTPTAPEVCAARQCDILTEAVKKVRAGGRIVYSTCTFNPLENEQVVAWALEHLPVEVVELPEWPGWETGRPDWAGDNPRLLHTRRMWPHRGRGEGHFIALLRVVQSSAEGTSQPTRSAPSTRLPVRATEWEEFLRTLTVLDVPDTWRYPEVRGDVLFARSPLSGRLGERRLKVLRPGICLATASRGRMQPHHHLAMVMDGRHFRQRMDVSPEAASAYLSGATLSPPTSMAAGYVHVETAELPLGFGKAVTGRVNNLYPKGLRKFGCLWTGFEA
jgi:NOL1/NOP2/sun family putative RNA methylase